MLTEKSRELCGLILINLSLNTHANSSYVDFFCVLFDLTLENRFLLWEMKNARLREPKSKLLTAQLCACDSLTRSSTNFVINILIFYFFLNLFFVILFCYN